VYLTQFYFLGYLFAKNCQICWRFDEVLIKTSWVSFLAHREVYDLLITDMRQDSRQAGRHQLGSCHRCCRRLPHERPASICAADGELKQTARQCRQFTGFCTILREMINVSKLFPKFTSLNLMYTVTTTLKNRAVEQKSETAVTSKQVI